MKNRIYYIIISFVVVIVAAVYLFEFNKKIVNALFKKQAPIGSVNGLRGGVSVSNSVQIPRVQDGWQNTYKQIPPSVHGKYDPLLPQWNEWNRRNKEDPKWEWKMPILFYGKVIDQFGNAVAGANVKVSWSGLDPDESTFMNVISDKNGAFSISGVNGKRLGVDAIEKIGYVLSTKIQRDFEYAAFFDETYCIPDQKTPKIFLMHKKSDVESLIAISKRFEISSDGISPINLKTGRSEYPDLSIEILENKIEYDPIKMTRTTKWSARLHAYSGGIQPVNVEFATIAPESGYQSAISINQDTPQPAGFQSGSLYSGGRFFVKTESGYAFVDFRMVPGHKGFRVISYLNPNVGSRNLEFDSSKSLKSQ